MKICPVVHLDNVTTFQTQWMELQLSKISNLALAVHLLLLLLLHLLDGSLRHVILPDPLLGRLRIVLRVLDLRRKSQLSV